MVLMHVLDVRLGFSFSAGLFDYVLNFDRAAPALDAAADRRRVLRRSTTPRSDSSSALRPEDAGPRGAMRPPMRTGAAAARATAAQAFIARSAARPI